VKSQLPTRLPESAVFEGLVSRHRRELYAQLLSDARLEAIEQKRARFGGHPP